MPDIKWIKLDTGIFEDEKIKIVLSMPDGKSLLVIWLKLLCLAGRINNSGVLMVNKTIPYTTEMLSAVFNEQEKTMRLAIETFQKLGMIEMYDGTLLLPNWEKHQSEDKLKEIRDKTAKRVADHRERQKRLAECNATVTLQERYSNADVTQQNKNSEPEQRTKNTGDKPARHQYGEYKNVLLTDTDLEKLKDEYPDWKARIDRLSEYIEIKGASYKNHYATIKAWARKDLPVAETKVNWAVGS